MMFATRSVQSDAVRDQRIAKLVPLVTPQELYDEVPLDDAKTEVVLGGRLATQAVLDGVDDRLLVVVGPCSVHDPEATREYAGRLAAEAARHNKDLLVAMRVYFEKPRTTIGWKGLINDPHLDGSGDVNAGLRIARSLLLEVLGYGLPVGLSSSIRSRPSTSQTSSPGVPSALARPSPRSTASSAPGCPCRSASRTAPTETSRSPLTPSAPRPPATCSPASTPRVARRSSTPAGTRTATSSCAAASPDRTTGRSRLRPRSSCCASPGCPSGLMIDASHDNSKKDPLRQPAIAADIAAQLAAGNKAITGVMVESFLVEGRQDQSENMTYGQSITDGCLGWDQTVELLDTLATGVRARRTAGSQPV